MRENIKLEFPINNSGYSVAENVYHSIKKNILNWNLKPGDRVSEKEMAERLEVSRTPVRESFITLSKEGLLEILPQRGTFISKISLDDVDEGLFIRRNLEIAVLKSAVSVLSDNDYRELEEILKNQEKAIEANNSNEFQYYDEKFHKTIFRKAKKEKTWDIIQSLNAQYNRVRVLTLIDINKYDNLLKEHQAIFTVLKNKENNKIEEVIANHLDKLFIEEEILKNKYPDYFV